MKKKLANILGKIKFEGDKGILIITLILTIISLLAVFTSTGRLLSHFVHLLFAYLVMYVVSLLDYKKYSVLTWAALGFALLLLFLTLTTGGEDNRGITLFGFDFQTFYLIGFLIIYFLSNILARSLNHNEELTPKRSWFVVGVVLFFCGGIAMANMSTAIILLLTSLVVLYLGKVRSKYVLTLLACVALGGSVLLFAGLGRGETFKGRVHYYFTEDNSKGYGDQIILAKAAIARSGFHPAGPGNGVIKKNLPEKETDYVYATVFEEFGILVGILILALYVALFMRSYKIALKSEGALGMLLAMGIGFWFTCQALVHIAVNTELCPATGQTLPFISRGGTSLVFSGIMIGVLLNISKQNKISTAEE